MKLKPGRTNQVLNSISSLLRGVETAMAEAISVLHVCRSIVRPCLDAGAVERAHERAGKTIRNPDSASIPEGALVEFEGVVL